MKLKDIQKLLIDSYQTITIKDTQHGYYEKLQPHQNIMDYTHFEESKNREIVNIALYYDGLFIRL